MVWRKEDNILLKLLFDGPDDDALADALNWDYIVETAINEGVAGVLFHNLKKSNIVDGIPFESYQQLQRFYNANLAGNMFVLGELKSILKGFKEEKIPFIVLKGIALAEHIYPGIAMRGMGDVDILVRKDNLFIVDDFLSAIGYSPRDSSLSEAMNNPVGYLASLDYRKDGPSSLSLHIHWHLVNTSVPAYMFAPEMDMDRIWEMASVVRVADVESRILSPDHQIIYLCEHALRIGHSFDRLILVCDIFQAIRTYEKHIDWEFITTECQDFNLSRLVYFALTIVQHYSAFRLSSDVMARLKPSYITPWERFFLYLNFSNNRIRGSSYLVYMAMNKSLLEKCKFLFRTLFPPSHILLQRRYSKHRKFSRLYYLFRIFEILRYIAALFHVVVDPANKRPSFRQKLVRS